MICGVDEAGKGPVMGPLVVAAVAVENAKEMENLGIQDSKTLTKTKRKELAAIIKEKFTFAVEIVDPEIVDEYRKKNKLNENVRADTAGSAKYISETRDITKGAIASKLSAEIYNLKIIINR